MCPQRSRLNALAIVLASGWLSESVLLAQCELQETATLPHPVGYWGQTVAVSGDTVVLGSQYEHCENGYYCGAAHVYRRDGTSWVYDGKLVAPDRADRDWFGFTVSVDAGLVVVSAPYTECESGADCGSAYVYRFEDGGWVFDQTLTASDASQDDRFGASVSISGDLVVVGAPDADCAAGPNCGAAYVFRFDGLAWVEEQKLTASDGMAYDVLGFSVSVSGKRRRCRSTVR